MKRPEGPFAAALAPLRARMAAEAKAARDKLNRLNTPDLHTVTRVWNGNEQANLEQLVDALPPAGGWAAYLADMDR